MPARKPAHRISVQIETSRWRSAVPRTALRVCQGARAALAAAKWPQPVAIAVLLADDARLRALNRDFRGFDKPTNVLAFPAAADAEVDAGARPVGDIAVALETCLREAAAQGKSVGDHLSHLIVHATLHLLGHDHLNAREAEAMEALERRVLAGLGVADPYAPPAAPSPRAGAMR
ncbi:MAG: rRNA maturation RNase YbeY [Alphaproteobacteria bacterium]|nr:rRNA maturation RNase YbeY [Alphaproteobacteria bacterium]